MHDVGYPMWEREDLTSDFRLPGVDPRVDSIGVFDDARLIGWAFLPTDRSAWVDVHPDARGRGIGTWLRTWTETRARERGAARVGQSINDRVADAIRLLTDAGYTPRYTSWILTMDHPERPADPAPPEGVTLRTFRPGDEDEALQMFEDAFAEVPGRPASTLATWRTMTIERDGFAPEDLVLAELDGEIVGGAFLIDSDEIWVDKFAVRRDQRNRGIARALLQVAFQRSFDRGYAVDVALHRFRPERDHVLRARRHEDPRVLHAPRDRPLIVSVDSLAVAEGFEPSGELPPHALSRRVPSAARAGHRDESSGRSRSASARAGASDAPIEERRVRVPADRSQVVPVAVEPRRCGIG